jgi:PhnB protein
MKLIPEIALNFNGQCEAAFRVYERSFNGSIAFMLTWADSPAAAEAPSDWGPKIYHATLKIGEAAISGGDLPPGRYEPPKGFQIVLQMNDAAAAEHAFAALSEGATIGMPLQETFWARRFGSLVDRFGIPWSINCERGD